MVIKKMVHLRPLIGICAVAVALAACNGRAPQPGAGIVPAASSAAAERDRSHPADVTNLYSGGADSPVTLYSDAGQTPATPNPVSIFGKYGGQPTIFYCVTGSGYAVQEFTGQLKTTSQPCAALGQAPTGFGSSSSAPDLIGSDDPLSSTDCCAATTPYGKNMASNGYGQPFEFPTVGVPIALGYGASLKNYVRLSTWTYCAIANGTISNWNDPALTADNGNKSLTGGLNETVTFYFRSDSATMNYVFQLDLNAYCNPKAGWPAPYNAAPYQGVGRNAAWTYAVGSVWNGPGSSGVPNANFIGEKGNAGVAGGIQSNAYGIGYLAGAFAKYADPSIDQAKLQSGKDFVSPISSGPLRESLSKLTVASIAYGQGSDGKSLGSTAPYCQLYIDPTKVVEPANSYPIVMLTYLMFYGKNKTIAGKQNLVAYLTGPSHQKDLEPFIIVNEFAPLPSEIVQAIYSAYVGSEQKKQGGCLTSTASIKGP